MNARQVIEGVEHKQCSTCLAFLPMEQFWPRQGRCKACHKANNKSWRANNPDEFRRQNNRAQRKLKYGITEAHYTGLLEKQGGLCAICGLPPKTYALAVDHDHTTGVVRGLLCNPCNAAIGVLGDDPELLMRAVRYLQGGGDS